VPTLKKRTLELREETEVLERKCEEAIEAQKAKLKDKIRAYQEQKERLQATLKSIEAEMLDE